MSSKFVIGDHVRVTNPTLADFDRTGVVAGYAEFDGEPASAVQLYGVDGWVTFKQSSLTLADPDVHTVLDQMDAESAPDAFKVGERVMIKGYVGSYGGRFGEVTGSEDDGAVEWLVRLDGNPVRVPFSEDELVRITPPTSNGMDEREIDGYVPGLVAYPVNHPQHYGGDTTYEVIKVAEAWGLDKDAYLFNVLKYVARAGKKGDVLEDLEKGDFYLNRRIATIKAAQ